MSRFRAYHALQRLLSPLPVRVSRRKGPEDCILRRATCRFHWLLDHLLVREEPFCFLLIGANDGISFDGLFPALSRRTGPVQGIAVEPIAEYFQDLERQVARFPGVVAVHAAIDNRRGERPMYRVKDMEGLPPSRKGIASFDSQHHHRSGTPSSAIRSELVSCRTFDDLLDQHHLPHCDLLQIDAEGYDAELIACFPFSRLRPRVVRYEHESLSAASKRKTVRLLEAQGYELFVDGNDTIAVSPGV